ncbi:hypothetical protein AAHB49_29790 [Bacillus cereus]
MEFLLQILLEITKTIAREGIVMGFKKLTAKSAKKTTRLPAKRGKSSFAQISFSCNLPPCGNSLQ